MNEVSQDYTERDELYRVLLNAPFEGIAIHIDGKIIEANAELLRMTGYSYAEITTKSALDLFTPQSRDFVLDKMGKGDVAAYEAEGLRKSGETFPVQIRGKPIMFRGQQARLVSAREITEFKAVEHALRESEQRFHDYARSGSDWFWEMDAELRFTYVTERFFDLTSGTRETFLGLTRRDLITPEQIAEEPEKWARHFEDLDAHRPFANFEYKFMFGSAAGSYISLNGLPIFDADGTFLGYRGTGTDISERKRVEEQLAHSEHDLRTIINNMADIFYRTDKEGNIIA